MIETSKYLNCEYSELGHDVHVFLNLETLQKLLEGLIRQFPNVELYGKPRNAIKCFLNANNLEITVDLKYQNNSNAAQAVEQLRNFLLQRLKLSFNIKPKLVNFRIYKYLA